MLLFFSVENLANISVAMLIFIESRAKQEFEFETNSISIINKYLSVSWLEWFEADIRMKLRRMFLKRLQFRTNRKCCDVFDSEHD